MCVFYSGVPPSQPLFRFLFFHCFPPHELLLNKQTNPLPPDTQLGGGDLLRLSGRILSNTVASVNNRKAPGSQRGDAFVQSVDCLPHVPFCLSPIVLAAGFCCQLFSYLQATLIYIIYPNGSSRIEHDQYVINTQAIIRPCLGDLLDNVQHRCLNRPVQRGNVEQVPTSVSQGDFSRSAVRH